MIIRIKRAELRRITVIVPLASLFLFVFFGSVIVSSDVFGANITNATVIARVNVTNTNPDLNFVYIVSDPPPTIDLNAGVPTTVTCNGTAFDTNGIGDITNVSAVIYRESVGSGAPDDNNTHYSNASCGSCEALEGFPNNGSCSCNFAVQYYANNGSWQCNMTIGDSFLLNASQNSTFFTINEVIGLNVSTLLIDYGNLSVTEINDPPFRNDVTNIGNIDINLSLRGYGGGNYSEGVNVTMICESGTNISFGNQRFSIHNTTPFSKMDNLSNQSRIVTNLTIPQRTDDTVVGNSSNATFWKLQVPIGAAGICNGTIIFGATRASTS